MIEAQTLAERRCEVLRILIIPENMQRGDRILDAIYTAETEPIIEYSKARKRIRTKGGTLYTVSRPETRFLMGHRADQIILDFAFVYTLKDMIDSILRNSCVPKEFQVIDDRKVLNGCIRHTDISNINI